MFLTHGGRIIFRYKEKFIKKESQRIYEWTQLVVKYLYFPSFCTFASCKHVCHMLISLFNLFVLFNFIKILLFRFSNKWRNNISNESYFVQLNLAKILFFPIKTDEFVKLHTFKINVKCSWIIWELTGNFND